MATAKNLQKVDAFARPFEQAWQDGGRPAIDDFLPKDGSLRRDVVTASWSGCRE